MIEFKITIEEIEGRVRVKVAATEPAEKAATKHERVLAGMLEKGLEAVREVILEVRRELMPIAPGDFKMLVKDMLAARTEGASGTKEGKGE